MFRFYVFVLSILGIVHVEFTFAMGTDPPTIAPTTTDPPTTIAPTTTAPTTVPTSAPTTVPTTSPPSTTTKAPGPTPSPPPTPGSDLYQLQMMTKYVTNPPSTWKSPRPCQWAGAECDTSGAVIRLNWDAKKLTRTLGGVINLSYMPLNVIYVRLENHKFSQNISFPQKEAKNLATIIYRNVNFGGVADLNNLTAFQNLKELEITSNFVTGITFPDEGTVNPFPALVSLDVSNNNITTDFSIQKLKAPLLANLTIVGNDIHGDPALGSLTCSARRITLQSKFDSVLDLGQLPSNCQNNNDYIEILQLSGNQFTATAFAIPNALRVEMLDVSNNNLAGSVVFTPLGTSQTLKVLKLNNNKLSGPADFSALTTCTVQQLDLSNNQFSGPNPMSAILTACLKTLTEMNLRSNGFAGSFGGFPEGTVIQRVDLSNNKLEGTVNASLIPHSVVSLDINGNNFTGTFDFTSLVNIQELSLGGGGNRFSGEFDLYSFYGTHTNVTKIDISGNSFTGTLSFPNVTGLVYLDLSSNAFSGVPDLTHFVPATLEYLDLSHNQFSGTPNVDIMSAPNKLAFLDLSYNAFCGRLGGKYTDSWWNTFDTTSVCRRGVNSTWYIDEITCPSCSGDENRVSAVVIVVPIVCVFLLGFLAYYVKNKYGCPPQFTSDEESQSPANPLSTSRTGYTEIPSAS
eukprot:PhF_6_TR11690/c0_g1_i1/m.18972